MTSKAVALVVALMMSATLVACSSSSKSSNSTPTTVAQKLDYKALGLWDDGPCDTTKPPLKIGLMTTFTSPVISLKDQADALQASAKAFNARGGANGSCIAVTACDDGANTDQAVACVRTEDQAGVVATVNDQGTAGQAEVSQAMQKAGIPRIASNVTQDDWGDQNAYPTDASGTGVTFLLPSSLITNNVKKIGMIRVDLAAASQLKPLISQLYQKDGATFPYDTPVPGGTTDYSQFILGAQNAGVGGVFLAVGDQDAVQTVKAAQQLGSTLLIGASFGIVLAKGRLCARRRGQADGVHVVVPAGHRHDGSRVRRDARRPCRVGPTVAAARELEGEPDSLVDRSVRVVGDDPQRAHDDVHASGHQLDVEERQGRPDAQHVRR